MNKYNEQIFGQSHSWVKEKANISSTKPKIPMTTISYAFSVLLHSHLNKFPGKQNLLPLHTKINDKLRHDEILVIGIRDFVELVFLFSFTNECLVCQKFCP